VSKIEFEDKKSELINRLEFRKYFKADKWEDFNREFFDGLAPKYDRLNEVLSLGQHTRHKKYMIKSAGIKDGDRILDLCTGSGDIAIYIAQAYPKCEVIAIDASEKMLEIARERAKDLKNVSFRKGDVLNLDFKENEFDITIISYGLRNLADIKKGILEMKRVTREGGRIVNLDLGKPKNGFLKWIHKIYFRTFVPFLGKTFFHRGEFNSFAYLPTSGEYFPQQEQLVKIFEELGLKNVRRHDFMLGAISQQIATV
jgi:demethylmenaquinone methyltransferase/2-methoxy-6-polyprenyl-1,4-benzoquinol methylase